MDGNAIFWEPLEAPGQQPKSKAPTEYYDLSPVL
jgi:hypothetical protein